MIRTIAIITISASAFLGAVIGTYIYDTACNCEGLGSQPIFIAFTGMLTNIETQDDGNKLFTFKINKVMHLNDQNVPPGINLTQHAAVEVFSRHLEGHCSLELKNNVTYTVYSRFEDERLVTSACWGTHPYSKLGMITNDDTVYQVPWDE